VAAALYDRIYATAVACAGKQPERIAVLMFVRAAIALEVLHEMKGVAGGQGTWCHGVTVFNSSTAEPWPCSSALERPATWLCA
jgi:hypothetical protein